MSAVRQIAAAIVAREGGYVNDPDDPGGATNYGVTIGTLQRLGMDLTGDGRVTVADVQALDRDRAVEIYIDYYYRGPGLAALPEELQAPVFDMYVNAGDQAVRILQRMLRRMGEPVVVDGILGPVTRQACHRLAEPSGRYLADAYGVERRDYYYAIGDRRPASRKYCRRRDGGKGGWILRAEEFISPRLRLSEGEHRNRCAGWG